MAGGEISLIEGQWPQKVLLRIHLAGLEGLGVTVGDQTFAGSYHGEDFAPGKGDLRTRQLDAEGNPLKGRYLVKSDGPNSSKRIAGYYEAEVPQSILNPETKRIDLRWVDFYRR